LVEKESVEDRKGSWTCLIFWWKN